MSKHVDTQVPQSVKKPRIVILGSGWGAMSFIKGMSKKDRYVFLTSGWKWDTHAARQHSMAWSHYKSADLTYRLLLQKLCLNSFSGEN